MKVQAGEGMLEASWRRASQREGTTSAGGRDLLPLRPEGRVDACADASRWVWEREDGQLQDLYFAVKWKLTAFARSGVATWSR